MTIMLTKLTIINKKIKFQMNGLVDPHFGQITKNRPDDPDPFIYMYPLN